MLTTEQINQQLIQNIIDSFAERDVAQLALRVADHKLEDALQLAFQHRLHPPDIIAALGEDLDYVDVDLITKQFRPKIRREWRLKEYSSK